MLPTASFPDLLRKVQLALAFLIAALLLVVPAQAQNFSNPELSSRNLSGRLQYAEGTYRVSVGDVLSINVYNQPDLSSTGIVVRTDGNASFNGIGELQVAGKTIREVTELLDTQMRELVREPRITLTVSDGKPPSVYLAGAVMRPGLLQAGSSASPSGEGEAKTISASTTSRMDFRLSNVLAAGGGVRMNADLANIMVTRDGQPYQTVNLWNLLKNGDTDADLMLQNGDSVYVPALPEQALDDETYRILLSSAIGPRVFPVRILGEVKTPGVYELNASSPYLNSAIAKGGGYTDGANRKVIALRRFTGENTFTTLTINPGKHDFMLRPNDVIFVSELKTYKAGRFAETVSKVLAPFTSAATTAWGFAIMSGGL